MLIRGYLQAPRRERRGGVQVRLLSLVVLSIWAVAIPAADGPIEPLTVCEVLKDLPTRDGKTLAVLGRFSFRHDGRTLNEETCGEKPAQGEAAAPAAIRLNDDAKSGPKPPDVFALDGATLNRKLKLLQEHTSLRTFRFGTPDYDRWAVVYGRIEVDRSKPVSSASAASTSARLVYRGDGVILFLHEN